MLGAEFGAISHQSRSGCDDERADHRWNRIRRAPAMARLVARHRTASWGYPSERTKLLPSNATQAILDRSRHLRGDDAALGGHGVSGGHGHAANRISAPWPGRNCIRRGTRRRGRSDGREGGFPLFRRSARSLTGKAPRRGAITAFRPTEPFARSLRFEGLHRPDAALEHFSLDSDMFRYILRRDIS